VAPVKDLAHDFVAEIKRVTFDSELIGRDEQAHERRHARQLAARFVELGDFVELPNGRLAIYQREDRARDEEHGNSADAPPPVRVRRIAQLDIIDVPVVLAAEVLLGDEVGRLQRLWVIWIRGRKELADQRKRSRMAAARL